MGQGYNFEDEKNKLSSLPVNDYGWI